jgi:hypothetical protein
MDDRQRLTPAVGARKSWRIWSNNRQSRDLFVTIFCGKLGPMTGYTQTTRASERSIAADRPMWGRLTRPHLWRLLALAFVIVQSVWVFSATHDIKRYSDEAFHIPQIRRFCKGKYKLDRDITTLPGYHAFAAAIGRSAGDCSTPAIRAINVAIGVLIFWVALLILQALRSKQAIARALSLHFLPILFPY